MRDDGSEGVIRRAIGGDPAASAWVTAQVDSSVDAVVLVMAALLRGDVSGLERARAVATSSRDRQVVAIARAHLEGRRDLVDALARDHLVDHPDSLIVAWMASDDAVTVHHRDPI